MLECCMHARARRRRTNRDGWMEQHPAFVYQRAIGAGRPVLTAYATRELSSGRKGGGGRVGALFGLAAVALGKFKYVLVQASSSDYTCRTYVRGAPNALFHADVAAPLLEQMDAVGLAAEVLGGGWIEHFPMNRRVHIWGGATVRPRSCSCKGAADAARQVQSA